MFAPVVSAWLPACHCVLVLLWAWDGPVMGLVVAQHGYVGSTSDTVSLCSSMSMQMSHYHIALQLTNLFLHHLEKPKPIWQDWVGDFGMVQHFMGLHFVLGCASWHGQEPFQPPFDSTCSPISVPKKVPGPALIYWGRCNYEVYEKWPNGLIFVHCKAVFPAE